MTALRMVASILAAATLVAAASIGAHVLGGSTCERHPEATITIGHSMVLATC